MFTSGPAPSAKVQSFLTAMMVVLLMTAISTVVDQAIPFFPFESSVQWRFERIGTTLGAAPLLLLELVLLVLVAGQVGSRMIVRWVSAFVLVMGILSIPAVLVFLLDFVEVRRGIPVTNRGRFDIVAMKTGLFGGILAIPAIWFGWRGWLASAFEASTQRNKGEGLVIGR